MLKINKIKFASLFIVLIMVVPALLACTQSDVESNKLTIYAAAGLQKPMDAVIEGFKSEKNTEITVNYGASGALYTQIEVGQPCDLYFSADWIYIEKVEQLKLLDTSYKFLNDNVVLIVAQSATSKITSIDDLLNSEITVAVAEEQAPIGAYSEKALKNLDMWDRLNTSGNLKARPATVNQVALMVEKDEVDAGLVYSSTAHGISFEPVYVFGSDLTGEVVFGAAVMKDGNIKLAKDFYDYAYEHASEFTQYGWKICK